MTMMAIVMIMAVIHGDDDDDRNDDYDYGTADADVYNGYDGYTIAIPTTITNTMHG